jgi:hypothetical protein
VSRSEKGGENELANEDSTTRTIKGKKMAKYREVSLLLFLAGFCFA